MILKSETKDMSQLVDIIDARAASCAKQLDKNWLYQLIGGVLGVMLIVAPDLASDLANFSLIKDIPLWGLAICISALLTYWFLNFGYLATRFLRLREDQEILISEGAITAPPSIDLHKVFENHSLFEFFHYLRRRTMTRSDIVPYIFLSILCYSVVVLGHAVCFTLIRQELQVTIPWLVQPVTFGLAFLLVGCYIQFANTDSNNHLKLQVYAALFVSIICTFCLTLAYPNGRKPTATDGALAAPSVQTTGSHPKNSPEKQPSEKLPSK
jgi:hypothetical protein